MYLEHLRAHLRAEHRIKELPMSQIGLYENFPNARYNMLRFPNVRSNASSTANSAGNHGAIVRSNNNNEIRLPSGADFAVMVTDMIAKGNYTSP